MSDVVNTLGDILPEDDLFHEVGTLNNPVMPLIRDMIQNGFTGDKGEGGFYRIENNTNCAVDLINGEIRPRQKNLPISAQKAADAQAVGDETLTIMINGSDNHVTFCKRFLARTLAYAADLIPAVTSSPQDIDDAMKLGFNWVRGPFELIDALGANVVAKLIEEVGLTVPKAISLISWKKSMKWSTNNLMWGRPLRSIFAIFNSKKLPFKFEHLESTDNIIIEQNLIIKSQKTKSFKEYFSFLKNNKIFIDQQERQKIIISVKYIMSVGSRAEVMHGNADNTSGGLKKSDLKYNKNGRIVSKRKSEKMKKEKL